MGALLNFVNASKIDLVQVNGQRKYGPPKDWGERPVPGLECEVFVNNIEYDCYEDELLPFFSTMGIIYELRLMLEFTGDNRGFAYVKYTRKEAADRAVKECHLKQIRPESRPIRVQHSRNNSRLIIWDLSADVLVDLQELDGMKGIQLSTTVELTFQHGPVYEKSNKKYNVPGQYAVVEFEEHIFAAMARRELRYRFKGKIDWAAKKEVKCSDGENAQVGVRASVAVQEPQVAVSVKYCVVALRSITADVAFLNLTSSNTVQSTLYAVRTMNDMQKALDITKQLVANSMDPSQLKRLNMIGKIVQTFLILSSNPSEVKENVQEAIFTTSTQLMEQLLRAPDRVVPGLQFILNWCSNKIRRGGFANRPYPG